MHPDWALALNPDNPAALLSRAQEVQDHLLAATQTRLTQEDRPKQAVNSLESLPAAPANDKMAEPSEGQAAMRRQIRTLASQTLRSDPLSAAAYQFLGMVADDVESTRSFMLASANRSRHIAGAHFWLLNDALNRHDYADALEYADLLLRTRPDLSAYVMPHLVHVTGAIEGFPLVVDALIKRPGWRSSFFKALQTDSRGSTLMPKLMMTLKKSGDLPTSQELAPYLDTLIREGHADLAYNAWLQLRPEAQSNDVDWLANGNIENAPSGLPFDWRIAPGLNAVAELIPAADGGLLHFEFGSGRVSFPEVSQVVVLGPGRYRLEGKLRGKIVAKRGLRWQLICASGSHSKLAETDMLMGETQQLADFHIGYQCARKHRLPRSSHSARSRFTFRFGRVHFRRYIIWRSSS